MMCPNVSTNHSAYHRLYSGNGNNTHLLSGTSISDWQDMMVLPTLESTGNMKTIGKFNLLMRIRCLANTSFITWNRSVEYAQPPVLQGRSKKGNR